jgi:hypothetical protein
MAHFAQIDENNVVTQVIVVSNDELMDNGMESEAKGVAFCQSLFGADTRWVQTSYNGNIRKNYAGAGYVYDAALDAFVAPKPKQYPSWVLDDRTANWVPPLPRPTDTVYEWNEARIGWVLVSQPYPSWVAKGNPLRWTPPVPYPTDGKHYQWSEADLNWVFALTE